MPPMKKIPASARALLTLGLIGATVAAAANATGETSSVRPTAETPLGIIAALPAPVSNNAVARVTVDGEERLYSFLGLGAGKGWQHITRAAYAWSPTQGRWRELAPVPVSQGRLASVAAVADGHVYLFGGYTVAEDGHEVSTPEVLRFDPRDETWTTVSPMPTPVDDSVAVVLDDRYIYLISGWHMNRNVDSVQVYDSQQDRWAQATAFPGEPLFGHAGALIDRTVVVCDGVKLTVVDGKRDFAASDACWRGDIAADDTLKIAWQRIASHPGAPRYRMGAAPDPRGGRIVFAGGSENPYNFDGIGYDERPSAGSSRVQAYSPADARWDDLAPLAQATMDHRGMPGANGLYFLIGGMRDGQTVSAQVLEYVLEPASP